MEQLAYSSPRSEVYFRDHPEDFAIKDTHWHGKSRVYALERVMNTLMARIGIPSELRQDSGWPW